MKKIWVYTGGTFVNQRLPATDSMSSEQEEMVLLVVLLLVKVVLLLVADCKCSGNSKCYIIMMLNLLVVQLIYLMVDQPLEKQIQQ